MRGSNSRTLDPKSSAEPTQLIPVNWNPLCPSWPELAESLVDIPLLFGEPPIVQDRHKLRLMSWQPIHATHLMSVPQYWERHSQLGWILYMREPSDWDLRDTSSWFTQLPRAGSVDIPQLFNSWALFLYPIYHSFPFGRILYRVCTFAISMTLIVYSSLSWYPTSSIGDWVFWIPFTM